MDRTGLWIATDDKVLVVWEILNIRDKYKFPGVDGHQVERALNKMPMLTGGMTPQKYKKTPWIYHVGDDKLFLYQVTRWEGRNKPYNRVTTTAWIDVKRGANKIPLDPLTQRVMDLTRGRYEEDRIVLDQ